MMRKTIYNFFLFILLMLFVKSKATYAEGDSSQAKLDKFLHIKGEEISVSEKDMSTEASSARYPLVHKYYPFDFKDKYFLEEEFVRANFYHEANKKKEVLYDRDELCLTTIKRHWDIKRKYIDVNQSQIAIAASIGRLLPQLNLSLSVQMVPVDISTLFSGLFGFIMPYRWFNLFKNMKLYDASRMAAVDVILDHYSLCEIAYYNASKVLWNFTIYAHFFNRSLLIVNDLKAKEVLLNEKADKSLMYSLNFYRRGIFETKKNLKANLLASLAHEANLLLPSSSRSLPKPHSKQRFMIRPSSFGDLDEVAKLDIDLIWPIVHKYSYKLQVIRHLKAASLYAVGETAFAGIGTVDNKASAFGIFYGLDTLANATSLKEEIRRVLYNYNEAESALYNSLLQAVHLFNASLDQIHYLTKWLEFSKYNFEASLQAFDKDSSSGGIEDFTSLGQPYMDLNDAYHNLMIANASINRLLVTPTLKKIRNTLPQKIDIRLNDKNTKL